MLSQRLRYAMTHVDPTLMLRANLRRSASIDVHAQFQVGQTKCQSDRRASVVTFSFKKRIERKPTSLYISTSMHGTTKSKSRV